MHQFSKVDVDPICRKSALYNEILSLYTNLEALLPQIMLQVINNNFVSNGVMNHRNNTAFSILGATQIQNVVY